MPSPLEDLINKYAEGGSVKNPFAHLSGNYRLGKVTPEDIKAAYADRDLLLKDREEILKNAVMFTEGQGYGNGGSVEYNPIKIDQIIDATHKELGTGRYADGGSVNTTLKLG